MCILLALELQCEQQMCTRRTDTQATAGRVGTPLGVLLESAPRAHFITTALSLGSCLSLQAAREALSESPVRMGQCSFGARRGGTVLSHCTVFDGQGFLHSLPFHALRAGNGPAGATAELQTNVLNLTSTIFPFSST